MNTYTQEKHTFIYVEDIRRKKKKDKDKEYHQQDKTENRHWQLQWGIYNYFQLFDLKLTRIGQNGLWPHRYSRKNDKIHR